MNAQCQRRQVETGVNMNQEQYKPRSKKNTTEQEQKNAKTNETQQSNRLKLTFPHSPDGLPIDRLRRRGWDGEQRATSKSSQHGQCEMPTRTPKREWTHQSISVEYKQIPILRQPGIPAKRESLCRKSTYATRYQMTVSRARSMTNLDRILAMLIKLCTRKKGIWQAWL